MHPIQHNESLSVSRFMALTDLNGDGLSEPWEIIQAGRSMLYTTDRFPLHDDHQQKRIGSFLLELANQLQRGRVPADQDHNGFTAEEAAVFAQAGEDSLDEVLDFTDFNLKIKPLEEYEPHPKPKPIYTPIDEPYHDPINDPPIVITNPIGKPTTSPITEPIYYH